MVHHEEHNCYPNCYPKARVADEASRRGQVMICHRQAKLGEDYKNNGTERFWSF